MLMLVIASCENSSEPDSEIADPSNIVLDSSMKTSTPKNADSKEVSDYQERLHDIVERMNNNLGQISLTGNPESDFSRLMITNLFAGIEISELQKRNGNRPEVIKEAEKKLSFLKRQEDYFHTYQTTTDIPYSSSTKKKAPELKHLTIPNAADKDAVFAAIITEYNQNTIEIALQYL